MRTKVMFAVAAAAIAAGGCSRCDGAGAPSAEPGEPGPASGAAAARDASRVPLRAIDPPAAPGSIAPSLEATGDGAIATWVEREGERHRVRFARWARSTGRWGAPTTVVESSAMFANWADFPSPFVSGDQSILVHWLGRSGEAPYAYDVKLSRSRDGGRTWSEAGVLHDDGTQTEHGFVSWVRDGERTRAFWLDGRATAGAGEDDPNRGPMQLRTAIVGDTVTEPEVVDLRVCDCCQTAAASTARGPVVVYRDRSEQEVRDISASRRSADGWTEPRAVHADGWEIRGCPVNGPAIVADGDRVVVAWYTLGDGGGVRAAISTDAGSSFGEPLAIDGGDAVGRVDLALAPGGDAIVSWAARGSAEGEAAVRLRRVRSDGALAPAVTVAETSAGRDAGFPRMALSGDDLLIAWVEPGDPGRIRAATIDLADVPRDATPGGARDDRAAAPRDPLPLGSALPAYEARTLDGEPFALSGLRGKPLVVSFWATWCEPCVEELPLLTTLKQARADDDLEVVAISVDELEPARIRDFAREHGLDVTLLRDASGRAATFGVPPLPATFVFDREGRLAFATRSGDPESRRQLLAAVARVVGPSGAPD